MTESATSSWPGPDDLLVITEMLNDPQSPHWEECYHFLEHLIQVSNLPEDHKKDVIQEAMLSVTRYLLSFHHECRLRTWLGKVANSRIMDAYRKQGRNKRLFLSLNDSPDDGENEMLEISAPMNPEDQCIVNEMVREAMSGTLEYLRTHAKPERNGQILQKVLVEQYSLQEAAQELGVPIPVVRYVVQSVQRYLQDRRDQSFPPEATI